MRKKYKPYVLQTVIALAVGGAAAIVSKNGFTDFANGAKPFLTPPPIVFSVVWTVLYILMGISAGLVSEKGGKIPPVYGIQLFVNFLWPIIFFVMKAYLFAFVWLVLLWVLVISEIAEFYRISPKAARLQIPYLVWITFAGYLNFAVWVMNM